MIIRAIAKLLAASPEIAPFLGRWDFGDNVKRPAVFTIDPAPRECPNPIILVRSDGEVESLGTRGKRGTKPRIIVTLWGDKEGSDAQLRKLATLVWQTLDRGTPDMSDTAFHCIGVTASYPQPLEDEEGFPGYVITATARIIERS